MTLIEKKCVPCEGGMPSLDAGQVKTYMAELPTGWAAVPEAEGQAPKKISKEFKFKDFKESIAFVNRVAAVAEAEGHHPDIWIMYSRVRIELWTHAIGGLSENDFILAAKIDAAP